MLKDFAQLAATELTRQLSRVDPDVLLESIPDGFFAVDEDWRFTYVNRHGESLLRRNREHLIGKRVWDEFPAAVELEFYDPYNRAVETQEDVRFTAFFPPLDTWFEVHAFPLAGGLSVYFDDVTDRWRQRKKLQVFSEATEHISKAIVITRAEPIDAFTQESSGNAREFEGSGLGLTITDHLIQLMGGSVKVKNAWARPFRFSFRETSEFSRGFRVYR